MFSAFGSDLNPITVIAVTPLLIVLPLQLLLCFKVKNLLLRLLPAIAFAAAAVFLFAMMHFTSGWDSVGYAVLGVFAGVWLIADGIAWGIWAIVKFIKKKK